MGHHEFYHVGGNIRMFNLEVFLGAIAVGEVQFFIEGSFHEMFESIRLRKH